MAFDYSGPAATALSLLTDFGQTMTLIDTAPASTSIDADTGLPEASQPATTSYSCVGVLLPPSELTFFGRSDVSSGLRVQEPIREANQGALIAASGLSVTPAPRMRLTASGTTYEVLGVVSFSPAGTALLFELVLKG